MTRSRCLILSLLVFLGLGPLAFDLAFAGGEPYVVFWSTEKCGKKCKGKGKCFTALASNGWAHYDLSRLEDTWTEVTKWAKMGKDESPEPVETATRSRTWENGIRTVYIRHPMTEVVLYDDTNFEGESVRLYGAGCHNLANWNFWDRAESIQVE